MAKYTMTFNSMIWYNQNAVGEVNIFDIRMIRYLGFVTFRLN